MDATSIRDKETLHFGKYPCFAGENRRDNKIVAINIKIALSFAARFWQRT